VRRQPVQPQFGPLHPHAILAAASAIDRPDDTPAFGAGHLKRAAVRGVHLVQQGLRLGLGSPGDARVGLQRVGEADVLAGAGSPGEIGAAWQIGGLEVSDVADTQVALAPVCALDARLGRIEVVGEQAAPIGAQPDADHAAAGEEFKKAEGVKPTLPDAV
jgi:hypothetical protein